MQNENSGVKIYPTLVIQGFKRLYTQHINSFD